MKKTLLFFTLFIIGVITLSAQTEIFNLEGGGALPSGWSSNNNITSEPINKGEYYLLQAGSPSDIIESTTFDLSGYTSAELKVDIRSFGGGGHVRLKVEVSLDGSSNYTQSYLSNLTTTSYSTQTFNISNISANTRIKLSNNNTSGRGVRMQDIILSASGSANDTDSDIDLGTASMANSISSTATSTGDAVNILNLDFYDFGSGDMVDTKVTNIRLTPKASNTADWTDHIQGLVLTSDGSTISTGSVSITDSQIDIPINAGDFDIADGDSRSLAIAVYLNTSNITDGDILSFMVDVDNHNFTTDPSGSAFANDLGGMDFTSNDFTIEVTATQLAFGTQPSDVVVDEVMSPAISINATDDNGNIDIDYNTTVSLSPSSVSFSAGATSSVTPVNGIATFNNLVFSTAATNETLTANSGGLSTATSDMFDITEPEKVIISLVAEPDGTGTHTSRFVQIKNIDTSDKDLTGWELRMYANNNTGSSTVVSLSGVNLTAGSTYNIAANSNAFNNSYGCTPDITDAGITGNGDDTYALFKNGTLIDVYGEIGTDGTGEDWEYKDSQAIRSNTVTTASATWISSQWTISSADIGDIDANCPVIPTPDNDECSNATSIMCGTTLSNETTHGATANGSATDCSLGRGVWYTFTGNDKKVTVSVDGASGFDPELAIASSSDCTDFHNIGCQDHPSSASAIEEITFFANAGVEYYFYVAHYSSNSSTTGTFDISVSCTDQDISTIGDDSCESANNVTSTGSDAWLNIFDSSDNIVASILDSENMGTIQTSVYRNTGAVRMDHNDVAYLDRNITIAPATQPSGTVKVRLYLTNSELSALMSADNSISGIGDINITKEDDDTCNGSFQGGGTLVNPTATGSIGSDHYLELDLTSFSSFFAHAGTAVLPVQLSSFTATPQNKTTLIKWTTSQELNNDYMAVERSSDGRNFTEIGRVQGAGNSDEAQQYSLIDKQPMAGVNYYRLRQVDFDGTTHFHKIVSVHFDAVDSDIRIAPTAVANHVMVYLPAVLNNDATINVYDANGRLWQSSQMTAGNAQAQFDFSQLAAGNYFLQIIDGQNLSTLRFTKL